MSAPPVIVGLVGKRRSGKDTFAAALLGHGFTRVAFADPLKAAAYALNPFVDAIPLPGDLAPIRPRRLAEVVDALGWEAAKDLAPEVRGVLQRLGVAMRDVVSEDIWIDAATDAANAAPGHIVFTDVRFPNEAASIREHEGILVRIVRPPHGGRNTVGAVDAHSSETALDDFRCDVLVTNDGGLDDLRDVAHIFADFMDGGAARLLIDLRPSPTSSPE